MRTRTPYLCDATIFAADDPRERVRKSGRVGADERARLVHVGAQLEELKMSTICIVGPQIQMVMYWNFLALDQHQSTTLHWLKRLRPGGRQAAIFLHANPKKSIFQKYAQKLKNVNMELS